MNSNKVIQPVKGFRDFLPEEALKRDWLKKELQKTFELWGFEPLETPTLEYLELFEGQIGEDEKLFFSFKDPGGRNVALRYDQTVPTCRVVGQYIQDLPLPFKRYQIQPAFRAEKPQRGRYREFLQADADIFGLTNPESDAEVIALSLDIYKQLGFPKALVKINDRQLLKELPYDAIVSIDKLEKIGEDSVIKAMTNKGISKDKAEEYLSFVKNLQPNETINIILSFLKNSGFSEDWYTFDPTIARSFSYSSGPIWEIVIPGYESGSVLGGERFDNLVGQISGKKIPGTGFGLGFDRTLEAAIQFNLVPQELTTTKVLVTVFSPDLLSKSLELCINLRGQKVETELYSNPNDDISKQLKYANKRSIPFIVILGPDEVKNKTITVKNMITGQQETLPYEELLSFIEIPSL